MASKGRSRSRSRSKQPSIKSRIKRPGALTKAAGKTKSGKVRVGKARKLAKSGTPLQKKQANFYLNVLRKGSQTSARRRKKK